MPRREEALPGPYVVCGFQDSFLVTLKFCAVMSPLSTMIPPTSLLCSAICTTPPLFNFLARLYNAHNIIHIGPFSFFSYHLRPLHGILCWSKALHFVLNFWALFFFLLSLSVHVLCFLFRSKFSSSLELPTSGNDYSSTSLMLLLKISSLSKDVHRY